MMRPVRERVKGQDRRPEQVALLRPCWTAGAAADSSSAGFAELI